MRRETSPIPPSGFAQTLPGVVRGLIALIAAAAALNGALPAKGAAADLPQVRADGRRLMFGWHGGSPHRVDVSNLIRAVTLESAQVLAAKRSGEVDYFVVSVTGPSRADDPAIPEPGGTETNLLWLKLKSWKLLDAQSVLYQSYWDSLDPIGDYHLINGILTIRYSSKRDSTDYVLRYDVARPENKITLMRASDVE
jgi:hypothetical protein